MPTSSLIEHRVYLYANAWWPSLVSSYISLDLAWINEEDKDFIKIMLIEKKPSSM